ncbi:F-box only protein 11 [Pelomyxa schiedti]|nr:F-box only protein 11 [Pelomyxa schiedti]
MGLNAPDATIPLLDTISDWKALYISCSHFPSLSDASKYIHRHVASKHIHRHPIRTSNYCFFVRGGPHPFSVDMITSVHESCCHLGIVGVGENATLVSVPPSKLISMESIDKLVLRNLSLKYNKLDIGRRNCITIRCGDALIEHCRITSESGVAVVVSGVDTQCLLQDCKIVSTSSVGIVVDASRRTVINRNEIYNCKNSGIQVQNRASPCIQYNNIHSNVVGVLVERDASCRIVDNDIHHNKNSGIYIDIDVTFPPNADDPEAQNEQARSLQPLQCEIQSNTLHHCYRGLTVRSGNVSVKGNTIFNNAKEGIIVTNHSTQLTSFGHLIDLFLTKDPMSSIKNNDIHSNGKSGISTSGVARIIIEGNVLHENGLAGITSYEQSSPRIHCNTISKNKRAGILIFSNAHVENNEIFSNVGGIETREKGVCESRENRLYSNEEEPESIRQARLQGKCTFTVTSFMHTPQRWYQCATCQKKENQGICAVCKDTCHKDHDLSLTPRYGYFYCDCPGWGTCQACAQNP